MNNVVSLNFKEAHEAKGKRLENQKQGHFAVFRSLLSEDWAKDVVKLSIWIRLIGDASYKPRTVTYKKTTINLEPGQLATTQAQIASVLKNAKGTKYKPGVVELALKFFVDQRMISTERIGDGRYSFTLITILNYQDYQKTTQNGDEASNGAGLAGLRGFTHTPLNTETITELLNARLSEDKTEALNDSDEASSGAGLSGDHKTTTEALTGELCEALTETITEQQNKKDLTRINNKTLLSENSGELTDDEVLDLSPVVRPDAAVQSPNGAKWGTESDLACAQWIFARVRVVSPVAKSPNWAGWSNDIRLLRSAYSVDHRRICEVFKWANADQFWQANVLSPSKLRKQWETLVIRSAIQPKPSDGAALDWDNTDWADDLWK